MKGMVVGEERHTFQLAQLKAAPSTSKGVETQFQGNESQTYT